MRVPDETLWPAVCGACGYPLRGLPAPRCPECGERVEEGEVVIVGVPAGNDSPFIICRPLAILPIAMATAILALIAILMKMNVYLLLWLLPGLALFGVLDFLTLMASRERGLPKVIWRICEMGYVFGAGSTKGKPRSWPRHMRVDIATNRGTAHIRLFVMLGPVPLSKRIDLIIVFTPEQAEGLVERLRAWTHAGTVVRLREGKGPLFRRLLNRGH